MAKVETDSAIWSHKLFAIIVGDNCWRQLFVFVADSDTVISMPKSFAWSDSNAARLGDPSQVWGGNSDILIQ